MVNHYSIAAIGFFTATFTIAGEKNSSPVIPVSINSVETHQISENLVRIIQYNMELEPKLDIEMFTAPGMDFKQLQSIQEIDLGKEKINFANSSGTYIEGISVEDTMIHFDIDHYYLEGGSIAISCQIKVAQEIGTPKCVEKE
ncbi:hypothetical protein OLMES_5261 [Oleiphilus messinensis]|uniref:Uncharacterized protein n=2 Tax=Oleiphilus messinensis TaxID=141451 RepID=A0A1Y0IIA1_9GAMM|nr:hypothetical protein OLMES_5261 [Oleiphilus messinensis]